MDGLASTEPIGNRECLLARPPRRGVGGEIPGRADEVNIGSRITLERVILRNRRLEVLSRVKPDILANEDMSQCANEPIDVST